MFCNENNIKIGDFAGLRETVKFYVKEKRYAHILGVEEEISKLANLFGFGGEILNKLKAAAILHDITKEFDKKKQLEICEAYNIKVSLDDKRAQKPVHAKTGAYIARLEFGADDLVFSAIHSHTLGVPCGGFVADKLLYLADFMEPNRIYEDCVEVREYFYSKIKTATSPIEKFKILDETMLFAYNKSIEGLLKENLFVHKDTVKYRNSFIKENIMV
ncbi:MAG: bis(5'-nucleosyl)-tetraphosphatase (symmetrical) YqeK [Oscillospiraceae bacterium]|nr:bis(5'-nucleosyl)-tetraphosphatase (symmetrical) YqeK [Oscillospiraceae bacterium]